jgi:hypothetical protein
VKRRTGLERAQELERAEALRQAGASQRQIAEELGIARGTLHDWRKRAPVQPVPATLAAFAQSPEGVEWLHRLVAAAHFALGLLGGGSPRSVCEFLRLSGLDALVGASYGSQRRMSVALEEAAVAYAREQRARLAAGMPQRRIVVCQDETYHPEICLVSLEPVSGFLLKEVYAEDRTAATWTREMREGLEGLPVEVVQSASDEAKGLLRHVREALGAHHSPDLFHVQYEASRATGAPLAREVARAEATVAQAQAQVAAERAAQADHAGQSPRPRGRPPAFERRIEAALAVQVEAERELAQAQERRTQARASVREISAAYHPYDLETGQAQSPARLAERLDGCWGRLAGVAAAACLPAWALRRLEKAQRVAVQMLATLAFFFATVQAKVEALALEPALETSLYQGLIPAIYLDRVAARSGDAERRRRLRETSARLLAPLRAPDHPLQALPAAERRRIEQVAAECADLFQRSSSAVEGRNGRLALYHHGCHRLSDRKLAALTAVHNYFIRRADGTTAAERFFGRPPDPMFESVLQRLRLPPRPARKRPRRSTDPGYLLPVAA